MRNIIVHGVDGAVRDINDLHDPAFSRSSPSQRKNVISMMGFSASHSRKCRQQDGKLERQARMVCKAHFSLSLDLFTSKLLVYILYKKLPGSHFFRFLPRCSSHSRLQYRLRQDEELVRPR